MQFSRQRNRETGTSAGNLNTLNLFDPNLIAAHLSLVPGVQRTSSAQPSTERQQGPVATSSSAVIEIGNDNNPCSSACSTDVRAPPVYYNEDLPRKPPPSYNEVAKKSPLDCLD